MEAPSARAEEDPLGLFTHEAHGGKGFWDRQMIKTSLFATQFGAVLFFAGSFLCAAAR